MNTHHRAAATGYRQVRAEYDTDTITVYQAYSSEIAAPAVAAQRFVPPFLMTRMTWIKPSFLWMMYRSGWGSKPGQERVLAIRIRRDGFEEALSTAVLSHLDRDLHENEETWRQQLAASPARVQWDPERDASGQALGYRSLQIGLTGEAAQSYVNDWVVSITDITSTLGPRRAGEAPLPEERVYDLPDVIARRIGATVGDSDGPAS